MHTKNLSQPSDLEAMSDFSTPSVSCQGLDSAVLEPITTLYFLSSELPSDHVTLLSTLQTRAKERKYHLLSIFLSECTEVLRSEIALLPLSLRQLLHPWQNMAALAAQYAELRYEALGPALEGALLSTIQIAMIIGCVVCGYLLARTALNSASADS